MPRASSYNTTIVSAGPGVVAGGGGGGGGGKGAQCAAAVGAKEHRRGGACPGRPYLIAVYAVGWQRGDATTTHAKRGRVRPLAAGTPARPAHL